MRYLGFPGGLSEEIFLLIWSLLPPCHLSAWWGCPEVFGLPPLTSQCSGLPGLVNAKPTQLFSSPKGGCRHRRPSHGSQGKGKECFFEGHSGRCGHDVGGQE